MISTIIKHDDKRVAIPDTLQKRQPFSVKVTKVFLTYEGGIGRH